MKEIKFRVYNKNWAMLVEDKDITMLDFKFPTVEFKLKTQDGQMHDQLWEDCLEDLIFMQYIGLKDKNGIDIYEGDIVKCYSQDTYPVGVVKYYETIASYEIEDSDNHLLELFNSLSIKDIEIIGDIYQNPELLN